MSDDFASAQEIIAGRLYFVALRRPDNVRSSSIAAANICYSIDEELLYEPFFADFGPLNLGRAYRYCKKTQTLLQDAERSKKKLFYYCGPHQNQRANAAVLVGMFQVLFLGRSADEAYRPVEAYKPFAPFRDASCGVSCFHLTVLDCLRGIQKARDVGFIDWNSGNSSWSIEEYEHYEQVENGDLNWVGIICWNRVTSINFTYKGLASELEGASRCSKILVEALLGGILGLLLGLLGILLVVLLACPVLGIASPLWGHEAGHMEGCRVGAIAGAA